MSHKKPNIIFILSDQHNARVIGAAGDDYVQTPTLDALYATGTSFNGCYCNGPLCVPSRSSMLTGQLPWNNGITNNMQCLPSHKATIAHSLSVAGYETVLCGRMHFVGNDQRHGYGKRLVGDITPTHIGADNEHDVYGDFMRTSGQNSISIEKSGAGSSAVLEFDDDVFGAAIDFIKNRDDERPLFLTVGSYGPHCPYIAPQELFDHYYRTLPEIEVTDEYKYNIHEAIRGWYRNRNVQDATAEDRKRIRAAYYAMVTYFDSLLGNFIECLEETIDMDNTVIVYGSDHGDNIGEHGLFWKTNFYEGASRVPLVFKWKDMIAEGRSVDELISLVDLAPTFIDMAEAPELPEYDGDSLMKVLVDGEVPDQKTILSFCSDIKGDNPSVMVRRGDYKLVVHAGYESVQLFNLAEDPGEVTDLGCCPEHQVLIEALKQELNGLWDGDDALRKLEIAKKDFALMQQWVRQNNPESIEEWRGNQANNFVTHKTVTA